ncbi:hypothetical protein A3752_13680 [Oleiphilus sp. HI0081]|nr:MULTISPECIES: hypothetical protein [unclassified Oleiphilus]KZY47582.1 hypothetical protein A3732_06580 [Oleiphilus sp. HI0050]KZY72955.1 hypothetical protein A3740_03710 [Oleiphilus sp. HI0068]KZY83313.1 hypothetical protein A3741_03785 [Oleiphilus sp. HI0069]KZY96462.1 hypothetical protein A3743_04575 [Oleiphilus sp. HI0072]KZZ19710.1 hypothetical protein A3752_13680 [Oleiphilus sp. HI0081]KZZ21575.1 hypothetical protein A3749_17540 [Oleiphilus sp. HI0078]KZZ38238.1 hypothetical protein
MSSAEASKQAKIISELRVFIRKCLSDPSVSTKCMEIARELKNEPDASAKIAEKISASTIVRIPEQLSDADKIFLEVIHEVLDDEAALY